MKNKYFLILSIIVLVLSLFSCPDHSLKVTFISYDNSTGKYTTKQDVKVKSGDLFGDIKDQIVNPFVKEGYKYTFKHWTDTLPTEGTIDTDSEALDDNTEIKGNKTVYAVYTKEVVYTVKLKIFNNDNSSYEDKLVKSDTLPNTKLKEISQTVKIEDIVIGGTKYTFFGWVDLENSSTIIQDFEQEKVDENTPITSDKTYCAIYQGDYLAFTAVENTEIYFIIVGTLSNPISLQYRKGADIEFKDYTWGESESTSVTTGRGYKISLNADEKVYFKGNNSTFSNDSKNYVNLISTNKVKASGSIMSIASERDIVPSEGFFTALFFNCSNLLTSPELPARNLTKYCYGYLFQNCSSLTTVPELPATTLSPYCYVQMFVNCTSLDKAPDLLAPELSNYCYWRMFNGCTSLKYIKCIATNISFFNVTELWTENVSSTGTFVCKRGVDWQSGASGIPDGWTVEYM